MKTSVRVLLSGCTMVVAVLSVTARLGRFSWVGDVLALFTEYYFWISILLLVGVLALRMWRWGMVAGLLLLLNGSVLITYVSPSSVAHGAGERDLRLLVYNVYYRNDDPQAIVTEVKQYDPDVVFLMEYSTAIQADIEPQFAEYPYRLIRPSGRTMGLALFSRIPLEETTIYRGQETRIPIFQVQLQIDEQLVTFVGGHPWPPLPDWGDLHRAQIDAIVQVAAHSAPPLIVAGDFNASPWSYEVQMLSRAAGVTGVRRGIGLSKTWRLAPGIRLPLDHILISPEWTVLNFAHGEPGGSDHVPLILDLHLR